MPFACPHERGRGLFKAMVSVFAPLLLLLAPQEAAQSPSINWLDLGFEAALEQAHQEERYLVLYFHADWSDWATRFEAQSLADEKVMEALEDALMLRLLHGTTAGDELLARFKVQTFPTMVFVRPDGFADEQIGGFIGKMNLVYELERIFEGVNTRSDLERKCQADPENLQACYDLAQKCWALGDDEAYWKHLDMIKEKDPLGRSEVRRKMQMYTMMEHVFSCAQEDITKVDLAPLEDFLVDPDYPVYPAILHEGYEYIAGIRKDIGQPKMALEAHHKAFRYLGEWNRIGYTYALTENLLELREHTSKIDRKLAVEAAEVLMVEIKKLSANPNRDSLCYERLADCYELNGQRAEAIHALENALKTGGGDQEALKARVASWKPEQ